MRLADRQLEALAAHHLHEDRELELARVQRIGGIGGFEVDLRDGFRGRRSPEYLHLHGLPPSAANEPHEQWLERLHPEDRRSVERHFLDTLAGAENRYKAEYRIVRPDDGRVRWIRAVAEIERDEQGRQRGDEFAVIEHLPEDSPYARANGKAQILMQGQDARQLKEDFKADANLTLEFMASNLTAKAQRIIWEQYPEQRSSDIVAAISERCRQAVANEETISQSQKIDEHVGRGISI